MHVLFHSLCDCVYVMWYVKVRKILGLGNSHPAAIDVSSEVG